jgi:F-type H+-transporting ATPase subunit b
MINDPNTYYTLAFIIFFGLLGRTLWGMATQMLDEKIKSISKSLEDAARMKKEAEEQLAKAQQKQKEAQEHGQQILALSEREIQRVQEEAVHERKAFLASQKRQLKERLDNLETVAFKELNDTIIQHAITSAERVIEKNINAKIDSAIIQDTIETAESLRVPLAS